MSRINKFYGEGQARNNRIFQYYRPVAKEKVAPSEKVTPSEEVEKWAKTLDDIEDPVVTIRREDLDNFQGQSTRSTRWFNFDNEWLKGNASTLELEFYTKLKKTNIKGQDTETNQTWINNNKFTEKLELPVRNDSVRPNNNKKQARDHLDDE